MTKRNEPVTAALTAKVVGLAFAGISIGASIFIGAGYLCVLAFKSIFMP